MPNKKALITDYVWPNIDVESEVLRAAGVEPIVAPDTSEETLTELAADADVIMFCFAQVTGNVLRAAEKCMVASRYGIGVDNIDIPPPPNSASSSPTSPTTAWTKSPTTPSA